MALAIRSPTRYGYPRTRAASRTAARALIVENVTICATRSVAVALGGVADHLCPVALVEVHVDVGHLLAPGVQEPFEEQVVADRVEVHDPEAVGHAAPGRRAPPGPHPDPALPGVADQVPDHQEVGGEPHAGDDTELVVEALGHRCGQRRAVAGLGPCQGEVPQVGIGPLLVGVPRELRRHRELGQGVHAELDLDIGALGDEERVVAGFGELGEQGAHLRARLQVVLLPLELEALGIVDQGPCLHAQQGVVGHGVLAVGVVAVVGGEQRGAELAGDTDQRRVGPVLLGQAMVLELHEEVVAPEHVLETARQLEGALLLVGQQGLQHDATQASGGGDDAFVVALEELPVDAGLVVVALEEGGRRQLEEVPIPRGRLGQQRQVVVELLPALDVPTGVVDFAPTHGALVAGLARHVGLRADDRVDARVAARGIEVEHPVHVPVIGDAERGLAVGHGRGHEVVEPRRAVEHRVLGVGVQMGERSRGGHEPPSSSAASRVLLWAPWTAPPR